MSRFRSTSRRAAFACAQGWPALRGLAVALAFVAGAVRAAPDLESATREVRSTELAFARSMAERDPAAFAAKLSEQAIFYSGPTPLRGKAEVMGYWQRWFKTPEAPFSWSVDGVDVTADGLLAHTTGPVFDPSGKAFARFHSVWRLEAPGVWRIVFDRGEAWNEAAERAVPAATPSASAAGRPGG